MYCVFACRFIFIYGWVCEELSSNQIRTVPGRPGPLFSPRCQARPCELYVPWPRSLRAARPAPGLHSHRTHDTPVGGAASAPLAAPGFKRSAPAAAPPAAARRGVRRGFNIHDIFYSRDYQFRVSIKYSVEHTRLTSVESDILARLATLALKSYPLPPYSACSSRSLHCAVAADRRSHACCG